MLWTGVNKTLGHVWQILGQLYVMDLQCVDTVGWVRSRTSCPALDISPEKKLELDSAPIIIRDQLANSGRLKNGR